jgi:hypothetical protein
MGQAIAPLLGLVSKGHGDKELLRKFARCYLHALSTTGLSLTEIAEKNALKTRGRFLKPEPSSLPTFDGNFSEEECLPRRFEIIFTQRKSGRCYLRWNGVFIGAPLTDNIRDQDGYRFHDVFHLAHAAILHWSPVFRALIKQKRKSDKDIDEEEDGGRAIVVEEGLTAWIFSRAKLLQFFDGQNKVSLDTLKTVHQFVQGYEVDKCPLNLWETAILEGYSVFRQLRDNEGGVVIGDRGTRTIHYKPLSGR